VRLLVDAPRTLTAGSRFRENREVLSAPEL